MDKILMSFYHQQMSNRAYFEQTWLCRPSSIICRRRSDKKEIVHNIIHCRIVIDSPRVKVLGECNLKKKGLLLLQKPYYTTSVCTANAVFFARYLTADSFLQAKPVFSLCKLCWKTIKTAIMPALSFHEAGPFFCQQHQIHSSSMNHLCCKWTLNA